MSVLITGCSTGIGLETARFLKAKGYDVIASARSSEALETLKQEGLKVVRIDVNSSGSIDEGVKEALVLSDTGIDVLINNAGFGQGGALEDISRDRLRAQFETNVFGLMELTARLLPYMRAKNKGRIINVGSILGLVSLPFRGAYNASKYAVEGLSDTLRLELSQTPIRVVVIEPGPVESQFRETCFNASMAGIDIDKSAFKKQYERLKVEYNKNKPTAFMKPANAVAKTILKAIKADNPRPRYRVTLPAHVFATLKHLLTTRMLDRILKRASKRELS